MSATITELRLPEIKLLGPLAIASAIARNTLDSKHTISATVYMLTLKPNHGHPVIRDMYDALLAAPRRDVLCTMIMPSVLSHTPTPWQNANAMYELMRAGWSIRHPRDGNLVHAKTWVFDSRISIIGSHNLTEQALLRNHDLSLLIDCPHFAARIYRMHQSIPIQNADTHRLQPDPGA